MKQYLRLRVQKPHCSTRDNFQQVVEDGYLLVVLAKYNVVQFRHVCDNVALQSGVRLLVSLLKYHVKKLA
jgi:hypothetical protein